MEVGGFVFRTSLENAKVGQTTFSCQPRHPDVSFSKTPAVLRQYEEVTQKSQRYGGDEIRGKR